MAMHRLHLKSQFKHETKEQTCAYAIVVSSLVGCGLSLLDVDDSDSVSMSDFLLGFLCLVDLFRLDVDVVSSKVKKSLSQQVA